MLIPYWDYFIEKNWNYTLYPEIFHSNVFCYGKPNSGRTEKVAIPIAETALNEGRSCIIYAEKIDKDYFSIKESAIQLKYRLHEYNADELTSEQATIKAKELSQNIKSGEKNLVLISNTKFHSPFQYTIVDEIIKCLYEINKPEKPEYSRNRKGSTLIILDELCGNMSLKSKMLRPAYLQFCIIMDSQIAYLPWLKEITLEQIRKSDVYKAEYEEVLKDILNLRPTIAMQYFLGNMETVICTGIHGVKPEMHRKFIGQSLFYEESVRLSGRYLIMEHRPNKEKQKMAQILHTSGRKIKVNQETIETSTYAKIAESYITEKEWIFEQDQEVGLYVENTVYIPIVFSDRNQVFDWLSLKTHGEKLEVLREDNTENQIRYVCWNGTRTTELKVTQIRKDNEEIFRVAYLLRVLEAAEYDDLTKWLLTKEAKNQGYDPSDGIDFNVQKYYENLKAATELEETEIPAKLEEPNILPPILPIEPYWEKFQEGNKQGEMSSLLKENYRLPENRVLFLGGHINMVKRIKKLHPGWIYITDDEIKSSCTINVKYVFYWTNHSSHKMMENIFGRLTPEAEIIYVTATNMERLENEMLTKFIENKNRKRRSEPTAPRSQSKSCT